MVLKLSIAKYAMYLALIMVLAPATWSEEAPQEQVLLSEAVSNYLERIDSHAREPRGLSPTYGPLWKTYGVEEARKETLKQALVRESDYVDYQVLRKFRGSRPILDEMNVIAARGLEADLTKLRGVAALWVARHPESFTEEQRELARRAAVGAFVDSGGTQGIMAVRLIAKPADRGAIRKVYDDTYKNKNHDGQGKPFQCGRHFFYHHGPNRGQVLVLLASLGDEPAIKEVTDAIEQEEDPQRRIWGWHMMEQIADPDLLRRVDEQLTVALDDTRIGNEPIDRVNDPEAKGPRLMADLYPRVCDIAVRAVYACDPDREDWPFKIPQWLPGYVGPWHSVHGAALKEYAFQEAVSAKNHNDEKHVFERDWVVGFTEEQIDHARDVAKKLMDRVARK